MLVLAMVCTQPSGTYFIFIVAIECHPTVSDHDGPVGGKEVGRPH